MKQIFTSIALLAMAISFASCDKEIICNCQCSCGNSDNSEQTGGRPGNNDNNNGGNNGGTNDNTGNGGTNNDGGSGSGDIDRNDYETYNNTFTYGYAGFCGVWYEEQPSNTTNWYIELADNNYDLENYEGTGYNIVFDLFAAGTSSTSIPSGKYTVEQFEKSNFSAGSLLYGYIAEDETYGEYPAGTWLYEGDNGVAAATAGWVEISGSGSNYTIKYELVDDEYMVSFKGTFTGSLTLYDATEEASYSPAQPTKANRATTKYFRLRK